MKAVKLNRNFVALVDDEDYERVIAAGNWYADIHKARVYVFRRFGERKIYLHRFILNYDGDLDIDHKNGNGLDCQKLNLEIKSRTFNNLNNHNVRSDNRYGMKGVYFDSTHGVFKSEIKVHGKKYHLGSFKTPEEAALARKLADERVKNGLPPKEGNWK